MVPVHESLLTVIAAIGGESRSPELAALASPNSACPMPPKPTPGGTVADTNLPVSLKVRLGTEFAAALVANKELRDSLESKSLWFRRQGDPDLECDLEPPVPHPDKLLWQSYAEFIITGTSYVVHPPAAPPFGRGDVADILWVTANFFLSLARSMSGLRSGTLAWPAEQAHGLHIFRGHMSPMAHSGDTNVTPDDVDFVVPPVNTRVIVNRGGAR